MSEEKPKVVEPKINKWLESELKWLWLKSELKWLEKDPEKEKEKVEKTNS